MRTGFAAEISLGLDLPSRSLQVIFHLLIVGIELLGPLELSQGLLDLVVFVVCKSKDLVRECGLRNPAGRIFCICLSQPGALLPEQYPGIGCGRLSVFWSQAERPFHVGSSIVILAELLFLQAQRDQSGGQIFLTAAAFDLGQTFRSHLSIGNRLSNLARLELRGSEACIRCDR